MSDRMHAETFAVLRHIEVHGPRSKAEITKGVNQPERELTKRLANLLMLGYLALDDTTKPAAFALTGKARHKLAAPDAVYPRRPRLVPKKDVQAEDSALSAADVRRTIKRAITDRTECTPVARPPVNGARKGGYQPTEYGPSLRPGANDAFALPSRMGNHLHWRDGTVTDMDGNPLP